MSTAIGFLRWFKTNGGWIDEDKLQIREEWDEAIEEWHRSVIAKCSLSPGTEVALIPKSVCLTPKTSTLSHVFSQMDCQNDLLLYAAVAYERKVGNWKPYFEAMPRRGERTLPMWWSGKECEEELTGTELKPELSFDTTKLDEQWTRACQLFESAEAEKPSWEEFLEAVSLASSRAFRVDESHGEGMVPLADLFNNAVDGEHVHVEDADADDDQGGDENQQDEHEEEEEEDDDNGDENGSHEDELRNAEQSDAAEASYVLIDDESEEEAVTDGGDEEEEEEEEDDDDDESDNPHHGCAGCAERAQGRRGMLTVTLVRQVEAGNEVFNTFDKQGNAALLHKYGYCDTLASKYTVANLGISTVAKALERTEGEIEWAAKCTGMSSDDAQVFQVYPDGRVESALPAIVWILWRSDQRKGRKTLRLSELLADETVQRGIAECIKRRLDDYAVHRSADEEQKHAEGISGSTPAGTGAHGKKAAALLRWSEKVALETARQRYCDAKRKRLEKHSSNAKVA